MTDHTPEHNNAPGREPVRVTRGLIAFATLMVLPAVFAFAVILGASLVADEVYAAELPPGAEGATTQPVAEWKITLVGICPIH